MSHCEEEGRHQTIFLTTDDAKPTQSSVTFDKPDEGGPVGLITPEGDINWSCPCLGGMPVGPCGIEFRTAFECFHTSTEEPKGSECLEKFVTMQECLTKYPELYEKEDGDKGGETGDAMAQLEEETKANTESADKKEDSAVAKEN